MSEQNFRPDSRTFYARQQPGGKPSCHSIPKVSGANVTPAISQVLCMHKVATFEGGRSFSFPPSGVKSSRRTHAASIRSGDAMNGHRITLSRSISSNRRRAICIARKKHTVPNDRTSTALIFDEME